MLNKIGIFLSLTKCLWNKFIFVKCIIERNCSETEFLLHRKFSKMQVVEVVGLLNSSIIFYSSGYRVIGILFSVVIFNII